MHKRLTVGITFFVSTRVSDIWSNGAVQNIIFLYLLIQKMPSVAEVLLVNGGDGDVIPEGLLLDDIPLKVYKIEEVVSRLDVLIDGNAQMRAEDMQAVQAHGGKIVNYLIGNDFVIDMERCLFDRPTGTLFNGFKFDAVWTLPHHERTCRSYFEVMHRCSVSVVPYIWSPMFLKKGIDSLANPTSFFYQPTPGPKRIAIFEPNLNVVKTCHYPLLVCEAAYRIEPELFKAVYVTNTSHMKDNQTFQHFIGTMDVAMDKVATIEDRFKTPYFLSEHTEIIVSHQWENQLNNLYLDVLYGGYPLVHNSKMLKCGYYYEPFNAKAGAEVLLDVMHNHDSRIEEYNAKTSAYLETVQLDYPDNISQYEQALWDLFSDSTST
ncbi:DUF2827 family protein [Aquirhabdus parva]|uniref:DUF2827 domain-containing protein n=1 Tax=Aquirhabdus parva TaxID=2283318 RepID=A0A345P7Z1_9GAMM|nr:DUF2827 family protein [Aquirhabdus parva]AXI03400.1 DUF2827 domain-containing protein [Aquirhabdus parva]